MNEKLEKIKRLTEAYATAIGEVRRTGSTSAVHPETGEPLIVEVNEAVGRALVKSAAGAILYQINFKPSDVQPHTKPM